MIICLPIIVLLNNLKYLQFIGTPCTWAVTDSLQEVNPDGDHVRSRVVTGQIVHGDLVGIRKIELRLHDTCHRP